MKVHRALLLGAILAALGIAVGRAVLRPPQGSSPAAIDPLRTPRPVELRRIDPPSAAETRTARVHPGGALPETKRVSPPSPPPFTKTAQLILFLKPGADPAAVGRRRGLQPRYALEGNPGAWVFEAPSVEAADRARPAAAADVDVTAALPNRLLRLSKFAFVPNDPYYPAGTPVGFPGQWYLGAANVPAAWNREITGAGVVLAILDDGLEFTHPDLAGNFSAADSRNFAVAPSNTNYGPDLSRDGNDNDEDRHGTSVGGVAAAVGGNGIGVTGAAPKATLAINRLDFVTGQLDSSLMSAVTYHAASGNTTIKVKNHSYGYFYPYVDGSPESSAVTTSAAAGTLHVYAAGNSRGYAEEDSNKLMPQNSPEVITVAAVGSDDKFADYSSFGANVFVTAPSSTSGGFDVTTTDRTGASGYNPYSVHPSPPGDPTGVPDPFPDQNYTSLFGGTSSAAPLVSGILALGKQANPLLTVRMVQHALVRTSDVVDATDATVSGGGDGTTSGSAWKTNSAGYKFNQNYGFGRINANNFILEVVKYAGVAEVASETHSLTFPSPITIPDNDATGIDQTFVMTGTTPLESIQVTLNLTHPFRGDLEAYVTSPSGTVCRLMRRVYDPDDFPDPTWSIPAWTFVSHAFWGENPAGTWHIRVVDTAALDLGTWISYSFTATMGTPVLDTTPPSVTSITRSGGNPTNANPLTFTVTFSEYVSGVDATDFVLATTGTISGATITGVSGGVNTYTVTVDPGTGAGTIGLNLVDNNSIVDGNANPLGGAGVSPPFVGQTFSYDATPPTIAVTSSTADGVYVLNAPINITLQFSKAVTLAGGNLQITLNTGKVLTFTPFAGQTSVATTYTVGAGETSPDLTVQSPVVLTGGATLRDVYGNNMTLTIAAAQNLAFSRAIVVDAAPPTGGLVIDGYSGGDLSTQTSRTTIGAHWSGFTDVGTGIGGYRWAIGTAPGGTNILAYTDVGLATEASTSAQNLTLSLSVGTTYYVTVEARDGGGTASIAASDGVQIVGGSATVPEAPPRLDALGQTSSVLLVWQPSPTAGVTTYRLWWKPAAAAWTAATLVDGLTGTSATVSSLANGTSYDFQLRALLPGGNESPGAFATATPANAITVNGLGNYGTIQAAINAAAAGDTILVQAGTYAVNLTLPGGLTLAGVSPKYTILSASNPAADVITATGGATLSTITQLTVTGGLVGVNVGTANIAIRNVVLHHNTSDGVSALAGGQILAVNCTIASNGGSGILSAGTTTIRNVIATGNTQVGVSAPSPSSVTYSDAYLNTGGDYSAGLTLTTDATTPVTFTDELGNDYTEAPGAFSIDGGDPIDAFALEPAYNGGRINMGAYGNTAWAGTSPTPPASGGGGGGGGGCGLTGLEGVLLLALLRTRRRSS